MNSMKSVLFLAMIFLVAVSCKPKGEKAEVGAAAKVKVDKRGKSLSVNQNAVVNWEGTKPAGKHTGTINVTSGAITIQEGKISSGSFVLDMNTINVTDLQAGQGKEKLEAHLKGTERDNADDFFNVNKYPTAKFDITKVTDLMNDPDANAMVYGNLTMKGKTQEIGFKANLEVAGNTAKVSTPPFTIDRTQWGITFMSKTAMDNLKDKFVNDQIGLTIDLTASEVAEM